MAQFNLADYEQVQDRIPKFYDKHKDGRITTELVEWGANGVIVKAYLYQDAEQQEKGCPLATGYAQEKPGAGFVNKTSPLENCETSAIGRALANIGLHGDKRASREEMEKVQRMQQPQQQQKPPAQQKQPTPQEYLTRCRHGLESMEVPADKIEEQLEKIRRELSGDFESMYNHLMDLFKSGIRWNTEAGELRATQ